MAEQASLRQGGRSYFHKMWEFVEDFQDPSVSVVSPQVGFGSDSGFSCSLATTVKLVEPIIFNPTSLCVIRLVPQPGVSARLYFCFGQ